MAIVAPVLGFTPKSHTHSYYARSGLFACICFRPGLCLQVVIAFSCPLGALLALFYERGVVLLGEVIAAARAARPQVGSLRAHKVRCVSTSVAFHRHWSVASVLDQPLGPPVRCFLHIILATFNTNLMLCCSASALPCHRYIRYPCSSGSCILWSKDSSTCTAFLRQVYGILLLLTQAQI